MPLVVPVVNPLVDVMTDISGAGGAGLTASLFFFHLAALLPLLEFDALFPSQICQLAPPLIVVLNLRRAFILHGHYH